MGGSESANPKVSIESWGILAAKILVIYNMYDCLG